jgi:hypothetical protein
VPITSTSEGRIARAQSIRPTPLLSRLSSGLSCPSPAFLSTRVEAIVECLPTQELPCLLSPPAVTAAGVLPHPHPDRPFLLPPRPLQHPHRSAHQARLPTFRPTAHLPPRLPEKKGRRSPKPLPRLGVIQEAFCFRGSGSRRLPPGDRVEDRVGCTT